MKIKKLLVLSILSLMGTSAWAEVPENSWTMPEPTGLEFTTFTDDGQRYYLYNPGAKMFFASGNSWGTQASVRTFGYPFWLESTSELDAPEGSYELWDDFYNPTDRGDVTGPHNLFTDDGGSTWVDHGSQGNYSWSFTIVGDYVRFQNVALIADLPDYEGKYIGWAGDYDGANNSSILKMIAPDTEGTCIDWKAVTEESYTAFVENEEAYKAYTDGVQCFFYANQLHGLLVEAEGLGANISAELAAFTNAASTPEELSNAVEALKPIIEARKALKKALDEAKAAGFAETADADAVYANGDATKAQLEKALNDLSAAVVEWGKTHATVENPANMTGKINNPNFDNASYTGWSGDAPNMTGSGSHGPANVPEKWNATFNTYQDVKDLPAGVYALGAQTYWRGSWNDMKNNIGPASKLYVTVGENEYSVPFNYAYGPLNTESMAGPTEFGTSAGEQSYTDEETGVTYYIPNDPSCFRLYAEKGLYDTKLIFGTSGGDIRIGVKNPSMMGDADNWSVWDTFTLTYYGSGADAAQLYVEESMKNFSALTIPEGTLFTESYYTAYQEVLAGDKTVNNFEEAAAIIASVDEAKKAIDKNLELWQTWQKNLESAYTKYTTDPMFGNLVATGALADYYEMDDNGEDGPGKETIESELALTNEELEAEIARVAAMVDAIETEAKEGLQEGTDVTVFMKNPDFEDCDVTTATGVAPGWTVRNDGGGNVTAGPLGQGNYDLMVGALGKMNYCFESWHSHDFDVYQEVTGAPEGVYVIEAQGYVRCENNGYTRPDEVDPAIIPIHLYMNNSTDVFPNVYSELAADLGHEYTTVESWTTEDQGGNLYPNSMGGAAQCFEWGMYKMSTFGLVKEGDVMRIGVKGKMKTDNTENWWCIWDNFKLTYQGYNVNYVQPALEKAMTQVNSEQPMGKSLYTQATGLEAKAAEAKASGDGKTMFQMLAEITDVAAAISQSVETFAKLQAAVTALEDAAFISTSDAKAEASALASSINDGIADHSIEDAEVDGLMEQIDLMNTKLKLPNNMAEATDDNPVECTPVIKSAAFENEETMENSNEGWNNPGNLGNDDTQKSVLAMEFWQVKFDMFQTIKGLPKGTYKLTADAWCRMGGNDENYNAWVADNNATLAYIYAVDGDSTVYSAPVTNIMKGLLNDDPGIEGTEEVTLGELTFWMPNSLQGGRSYMDINEGVYTNSLICKVGDDGVLTVGIKKAEEVTNSWVVLDNFKLYYFGANSSQQPSGDAANAISTLEFAPVKVEFYTVGGARISKPGKGVAIVKQTLSDGTVKMHKVIVK